MDATAVQGLHGPFGMSRIIILDETVIETFVLELESVNHIERTDKMGVYSPRHLRSCQELF